MEYGTWKVTIPGEEYTWDIDATTVNELSLLEQETGGVTFKQWITDIDARKSTACQTLIWYLRRKNGQQMDRFSVDFPIFKLKTEKVELPEDPAASPSSDAATSVSSPDDSVLVLATSTP